MMGVWLVLAALPGCWSDPDPGEREALLDAGQRFSDAQLDDTWIVRLAAEQDLAPYAAERGWVALVMERNLIEAVRLLGPRGGLGAARAHAEAAYMYRQAALIAANSLVEVYGETPLPSDPVGAAHLVAVGRILQGKRPAARAALATLAAHPRDPTQPWDAPWRDWLATDAPFPPDFSALPMVLPEPEVGRWPRIDPGPHYRLPERPADGPPTRRSMADPSVLVAVALWHDGVAREAAGDQAPLLAAVRAGYRWPVEAPPTPAGAVPLALLFGSDLLVAGDGDFLADLHGALGAAAVDAHAASSVLAWMAQQARVDGHVDPDRAADLAVALRDDLLRRARRRTEGRPQGHHRQFAEIARVGALRSLALVAEVEGDREASGRLRLQAWEQSQQATACPVGLLALAAWDVSNRYPLRAADILHSQSARYPSLQVARYGLDVLALRVGQERGGAPPGL